MSSSSDAFPSLIIRPDGLEALGAFAESQAAYLNPDAATTSRLTALLRERQVGVVAHFYMDPELQGVLTASDWSHIHISDSLAMADRAVKMVEAGAKSIVVLGVDFMSENVRAMLDAGGFEHVPVYRVATETIGCSLADAALSPAYEAYLGRAGQTPRSLHVIYINTSLVTKARAQHVVPTITCTSSNVVKTVLQAFSQVPELSIWYGPDTYMGENLQYLFERLTRLDERSVAAVHPAHSPATVRASLDRFHYFEQGNCIVHHLFGQEVVETLAEHYADAFITAHLEVPGEMFRMALDASQQGRGAVGSTANILSFIAAKVDEAAAFGSTRTPARDGRLRFVLGTEAGMITAIVRRVQESLRECHDHGGPSLEAEIIFPVASEAIAPTSDAELGVVPGAADGEGCSIAGGCVTCPYMKMNSLGALFDLLPRLDGHHDAELEPYRPRKYVERIAGRTAAELGGAPILSMREFQRSGRLSEALVADILQRRAAD